MSKILMIWEQGSGLGHMTTMLPIAQSLLDQGHEIYVALKDFSKAHSVFDGNKFRLLPSPVMSGKIKGHFRLSSTFAHIMHNVGFGDHAVLESQVSAWFTTFSLLQPDLVITDHSPVAMLAARARFLRTVSLGTGFSCPAPCAFYPDWRPEMKNSPGQLAKDEKLVLDNANKILRSQSAKTLERLSDLYRDVDDCLLITYPELDPFTERKSAEYLGLLPAEPGESPQWPTSDQPRVFAYLRAIHGIENLLHCLAIRRLACIIRMPGAPPELQEKFPTLHWEDRFVDLDIAAAEADICVGHGTHMMTARWLLAGKPILMLPPYLEQSLTAQRVVSQKAGMISSLKHASHLNKTFSQMLSMKSQLQNNVHQLTSRYQETTSDQTLRKAIAKVLAIL